jgi:ligand-binding sensor domain-containing protein/two-component sensor histidine kinase
MLVVGLEKSVSQQYQFTNYSVTDGLPQSQVFAISQTADGYVWMATQGGGLSQFDGEDFQNFSTEDGLLSNYVHCLLAADSALFIGTNKGLNIWVNQTFLTLDFPIENVSVAHLLIQADNRLQIATNLGLFVYDGVSIERSPLDLKSIGSLYALATDLEGNLWIGGNTGLMRCFEGVCTEFTLDSGLSVENVRSLCTDKHNNLWIGTYGGGVNVHTEDGIVDLQIMLGLEKARVHDIFSDNEGSIWFATQQRGLCQFNTANAETVFINEKNGLANNHTRSIFRDEWQNFWIGTSGGGVSKYTGQQFNYLTEKQGLTGNYIYSVSEDERGNILIGSSGRGLQILDSGKLESVNLPTELNKAKIKTMYQAGNCSWWYGTDGSGVWIEQADSFYHINTANGLKSNYVRAFLEDNLGQMWVATAGGGIQLVKTIFSDSSAQFSIESIGQKNGVEAERINDMVQDHNGRIWFASLFKGIGILENNQLLKQLNLLNSEVDNNINCLASASDGSVWAGSVNNGIYRILENEGVFEIQHFQAPTQLSSNIVYQLIFDDLGHLWVGSEKGVERLKLSASGEPIDRKLFNQEDGFLGVETTLNAAFKAEDGTMWFGTINGLSSFDDDAKSVTELPPRLSILRASVNAVPFNFNEVASFSYDSNLISFEYKAVSQSKPRSIRYKIRLLGLDSSWSESSQNQSITYSNLPAGDFTFQVIASTNGAEWTLPKTVSFSVRPAFWKTDRFIIISSATASLLIALLAWLIYANVRRKIERKQQELTMEKELVMLEQKALRLQMNPHFIFNALNSIQALVSSNDSKTARLYLAKFSRLMRQILDNSRRVSIPLENEIATLENYLAIEQFCNNHRFDYEITYDDELDIESIEIPPIIVQPFVENAIVHGVTQLDKKGKISVRFFIDKEVLVCEVEDNGIGRNAASKMKSQRDQQHKSTALLITQERLDTLNKKSIQPSISFNDLLDENGAPNGTCVRIRIEI